MNVFILSIGFGPYAVQLARGLGRSDRVAIALNNIEGQDLITAFPDFFDRRYFTTHLTPHYRFPDPRKFLEARRLHQLMLKHGAEVLHVQIGQTYTETLWAVQLARLAGLPVVATVHDVSLHPGDFVSTRSMKVIYGLMEAADQFIVHSTGLAEEFVEKFGFDRRVTNVVPHGNYDIYKGNDAERPDVEAESARIVLFGRMKRYKGLSVLLEAAPLVVEKVPEARFIVAGRGEELDLYQDRMEASPYFEVHNRYIPNQEVSELFRQASLVVIPYIEASQSGPLHLAFSFGRPVVASRTGGIPEAVEDGVDGLLVEPGDARGLAEAMIKVLTDRKLAERLGRAAAAKAEGPLNWSGEIAEKTRRVYQKAIDDRRNGVSYPGLGRRTRWRRLRQQRKEVAGGE